MVEKTSKLGDYPASWDNPSDLVECGKCGLIHVKGKCPSEEEEAFERFCDFVNREVRNLTAYVRQKAEETMNVAKYVNEGGGYESLPLLDARAFKREKDAKGFVVAKIIATREIKSKKKKRGKEPFHGLAIDIKVKKGTKYTFLTSMEGYDIGHIVDQLGSDDTDDWAGASLKFVLSKGKYVNVFRPTKGKK